MKFILATTDPQKIPVTVLSRCLQFNLKQMPRGSDRDASGASARGRKDRLRSRGAVADRARRRAAACATRSRCSTRRSRMAAARWRAAGVRRDARRDRPERILLRLLEALAAGDAAAAVAVADEMQARSLSFDTALADLASLLLQHCARAIGCPMRSKRSAGTRAPARARAATSTPESVQLYYQIALQGREDLPLAPDEHGGFVMTMLRMLAFRPEGAGRRIRAAADCAAGAGRDEAKPAAARKPTRDWPQLVQQPAGDRRRARARAQRRARSAARAAVRAGGAEGEGVSRRARYIGQAQGRARAAPRRRRDASRSRSAR